MPEMDGKEQVSKVRATPALDKMPIIVMSGVVGLKEITGIMDLGASFFIGKPLNSTELHEYVDKSLNMIKK